MNTTLREHISMLNRDSKEFEVVSVLGTIYNKYSDAVTSANVLNNNLLSDEEADFISYLGEVDTDFELDSSLITTKGSELDNMLKLIAQTEELDGVSLRGLYCAFCNTSFPFEHFVRYECHNLSVYQLKLLVIVYMYCFYKKQTS